MKLHPDFRDFLAVLDAELVEALIIGGYAVSFHSKPMFTKDIDLFVNPSPDNRERLARALARFGAPPEIVEAATTASEDEILWFGATPTRIDLLFRVPGAEFTSAYARRSQTEWEGVPVRVIGKEDLLSMKRAAGRRRDLQDIKLLTKGRSNP